MSEGRDDAAEQPFTAPRSIIHFSCACDAAIACTVRSISSPSSNPMTAPSPVHRVDQFAAFDDFQIVEAEPMSRRGNELRIGRMRRAGEDGAVTLLGRPGPR